MVLVLEETLNDGGGVTHSIRTMTKVWIFLAQVWKNYSFSPEKNENKINHLCPGSEGGQLWEERMGSGQEQISVLRSKGKWSIPGKASHNSPTGHLPFFFVNQEMSNMFPFRKYAVPYTLAYISPIRMAFVHQHCNVLCQLLRG